MRTNDATPTAPGTCLVNRNGAPVGITSLGGSMRCPDCCKFVSMEQRGADGDALLEVDDKGNVTGSLEIVNECAECSGDLKSATLDFDEGNTTAADHVREHHASDDDFDGFEIEETNCERTERSEGQGRGRRTYYGATVDYTIKCNKCEGTDHPFEVDGQVSDEVQASSMDELV